MKAKLYLPIAAITFFALFPAHADYFDAVRGSVMNYKFDDFTLPANPGETTYWEEAGSLPTTISRSDTTGSYIALSINGTLVGDNIYATSNPGIGIQYKTSVDTLTDACGGTESTLNSRFNLGQQVAADMSTYVHVKYRLVRLTNKIPAGKITSAPQVTATFYNPDGRGTAVFTHGIYSSTIASQPKTTSCTVDAPTEIKLPALYGNKLKNGAQTITEAPTIKLINCPGAIDGISYNFSAVYGARDASNGILNAVNGDGYAQNVYIQVQNADGTPHMVNSLIALSDYTGSGEYEIPEFKVAYYIENTASVTAGEVKSAIELKLTYN
ncbi:TPA: type 1 fimbrial protein [Klebsiella oxytoca]|jgi:type 1 fimbria pilin|uniref:fimbrial protein n=1 Tax=Klebsiella oxytoca TaxID=571 RepID=UPI001BD5B897|nr:fimbrial protein [Klebsiella oxytoca]MDM4270808.1 fimbrial protein [Klebsiella oxytoca]MDU7175977.1 fimbrial protein [Klebsiella oxytoca]HEF4889149.1 type 1 fimbrial protein [Klebsiella oxytoca]